MEGGLCDRFVCLGGDERMAGWRDAVGLGVGVLVIGRYDALTAFGGEGWMWWRFTGAETPV
jgi:hypothetical protein